MLYKNTIMLIPIFIFVLLFPYLHILVFLHFNSVAILLLYLS